MSAVAQRSHASRSSWNCRSISSQVGALRGPGGNESRNSRMERVGWLSGGRGITNTSTYWPSFNPGAVISILLPGWTRVVVWSADRMPSVGVAIVHPPFSNANYLKLRPVLSTPGGGRFLGEHRDVRSQKVSCRSGFNLTSFTPGIQMSG
jgi:hypothetical protein